MMAMTCDDSFMNPFCSYWIKTKAWWPWWNVLDHVGSILEFSVSWVGYVFVSQLSTSIDRGFSIVFSDFPWDFPRSTWLDILYELQTSPNIPKQFTNVWCYFEMKAYNIYIYSIWKLYNLIYICVCDSLSLYIYDVCVCLAYMKVFLDQSAKPSTMSCYFYFFWVKAIAMQSTCFDGQEKRYLQLKWLASACVGYMLAILPSFLIP